MTAHNLPIWKLMVTLQTMLDEGYTFIDLRVEDDATLSIRGKKKIEDEDDKPDDINQLII